MKKLKKQQMIFNDFHNLKTNQNEKTNYFKYKYFNRLW